MPFCPRLAVDSDPAPAAEPARVAAVTIRPKVLPRLLRYEEDPRQAELLAWLQHCRSLGLRTPGVPNSVARRRMSQVGLVLFGIGLGLILAWLLSALAKLGRLARLSREQTL